MTFSPIPTLFPFNLRREVWTQRLITGVSLHLDSVHFAKERGKRTWRSWLWPSPPPRCRNWFGTPWWQQPASRLGRRRNWLDLKPSEAFRLFSLTIGAWEYDIVHHTHIRGELEMRFSKILLEKKGSFHKWNPKQRFYNKLFVLTSTLLVLRRYVWDI